MHRRRFLIALAGTGAAVALGSRFVPSWLSTDELIVANPLARFQDELEIVTVEPGFVDATTWRGELLTLRAAPGEGGITVVFETDAREYPVSAPDGFVARALGTNGGNLLVAGHRVVNGGEIDLSSNSSYEQLLADAGAQASALMGQPGRPSVHPGIHVFAERRPEVALTADLDDWSHQGYVFRDGTAGSISSVLDSAGRICVDHWFDSEIPDSIVSAEFIDTNTLLSGREAPPRAIVPIDHGHTWGKCSNGESEFILIQDRDGIRGVTPDGTVRFEIADEAHLLGVNASGTTSAVDIQLIRGPREIWVFEGAVETERIRRGEDDPVLHRFGDDIYMATGTAKHQAAATRTKSSTRP